MCLALPLPPPAAAAAADADADDEKERKRARHEPPPAPSASSVSSDDGSSGALKRALSEAEASEVAAAWAFPEGSKAVVCSLPSGDGGSSVDILGKHMAR
jgi:hypothetical protein